MLADVARVLRPGGRFAVSDVIADPELDDTTPADMAAWTGCIAGALTADSYPKAPRGGRPDQVEIRETPRVHPRARSAVIRAQAGRRPPGPAR